MAERERWLLQIDEATGWMTDQVAAFAGSWPSRSLIDLAVTCSGHARMVVLSEREETTKLEPLGDMPLPVQRQFFGFRWTRARHFHAGRRAFAEIVARCRTSRSCPSAPRRRDYCHPRRHGGPLRHKRI